MTTSPTSRALDDVLAGTSAVLLDFDGPVCDIFPGGTDALVADRLRAVLAGAGFGAELLEAVAGTPDPLQVLRHVASLDGTGALELAERELIAAETEAALRAVPTPGAAETVRAARATGRALAIVSNNAATAIRGHLDARGLGEDVEYVAGRPHAAPDRMKPHPGPVLEAAAAVGVDPTRCVLVGDSATDIAAAHAAGAAAIGYVKRPDRREALTRAGADVLVDSMLELAAVLAHQPGCPQS